MDKKERILIVDDDEVTCRTLALIFGKKGYETEMAGTGREAIEKAKERSFNLALLDIKLPDMEGVELLAPLKEIHPDMLVIMATAYASVETAVRALNEGASAYITKPLNMDEVLAIVRQALEKQRLVEEKLEAEKKLARSVHDLEQTVDELRLANQKILEQQKAVIAEERLRVLLQMAGATAHELNQPLMGLLGNIELMRIKKDNPEQMSKHMDQIEGAGQRIADIVKKIQNIRHDETMPYHDDTCIINLDQKVSALSVEDSNEDFEMINGVLKDHNQIDLSRAMSIEGAMEVLKQGHFDLIFLDHILPDGNSLDFLRIMDKRRFEIPVVVITGKGDEMTASQVIQAGAYGYLSKDRLSDKSIFRVIISTLEKARLKKEMREAQKKMADMRTRDELTGLYNR